MARLTPPDAAPETGRRPGVVAAAAAWSRRTIAAVLLMAFVLAVVLPTSVATSLILLVAGVGFLAGLPHGAVDHLLLSRLATRSLLLVTLLYAATTAAAWILLNWAGPVVLGVVVLLSVVHFGLGEVQVYRDSMGWRPGRCVSTALAVAGTGALLIPLARSGEVLGAVATAMSPGMAIVLATGLMRWGVGTVWLVAACVAAIAALRARRAVVVLDLVLIGALGAFLPPLAAFAVWFGGWHAVRHTGRLLGEEPGCAELVTAGRTGPAVRRFARLATLPSLAALAVLLVLALFATTAPDPELAIAEVLQVLLALTVPHMLVVLWLDRRGRPAGA
jgi:Brp/Blh family beta-carotene 15,15'-monooxygenase